MPSAATWEVLTKKIPWKDGAPQRGAALMRRTSVFAIGENLGVGGIHFRRAFESPKGGDGGIRALDLTDANRTLSRVSWWASPVSQSGVRFSICIVVCSR